MSDIKEELDAEQEGGETDENLLSEGNQNDNPQDVNDENIIDVSEEPKKSEKSEKVKKKAKKSSKKKVEKPETKHEQLERSEVGLPKIHLAKYLQQANYEKGTRIMLLSKFDAEEMHTADVWNELIYEEINRTVT